MSCNELLGYCLNAIAIRNMSGRALVSMCSIRCSVLQCVAVCCSVLQCVAVCCSVLQCVAVCGTDTTQKLCCVRECVEMRCI